MPARSNVSEFAGRIRAGAKAIEVSQRTALTAAAKVFQKGATDTLEAAAPGGHLRNVKNSKLAVGVTVTGTGDSTTAKVYAKTGAYAILDNPVKAHYVGRGRSTKKVKKGFAGPSRPGKGVGHPMQTPYGWRTGPFLIKLHDGKHTFARGTQAVIVEAGKAAQDATVNAVAKALA